MYKKILIVEDDESLRQIYSYYLELEGYEVIQAPDGEEALNLLVNPQNPLMPDCILTDIMMPKLNGRALIEIIRTSYKERFANVPIIVCSAFGEEVEQRYINAKLSKPVSLGTICQTIGSAMC